MLGEFQGKSVGERRTWTLASGQETPPGAETIAEFESRVRRALERISNAPRPTSPGAPVAVVTHGGPVRVILRLLASGQLPVDGAPPPEPGTIENCSILELRRTSAGRWRIACVNDASHLAALRTATDAG